MKPEATEEIGESVSGYVNDLGWEKGFLHRDHERKMSHLIKISEKGNHKTKGKLWEFIYNSEAKTDILNILKELSKELLKISK